MSILIQHWHLLIQESKLIFVQLQGRDKYWICECRTMSGNLESRMVYFAERLNGGMTEWQNEGMTELCVRSPFSLASDLQIIIGICDYDVTYTNNSWYSVTMMSRLRVLCRRQQQQKHFWNKVYYYSLCVRSKIVQDTSRTRWKSCRWNLGFYASGCYFLQLYTCKC